MITYTSELAGLTAEALDGFFVGWPSAPSPARLLEILHGSSHVVLAVGDAGRVVGFVNALSDGVLSAYLPLLEVVPDHQGQGIGSELIRRMLSQLEHLYAIDLVCDPEIRPFYERLGMTALTGMVVRNRGQLV